MPATMQSQQQQQPSRIRSNREVLVESPLAMKVKPYRPSTPLTVKSLSTVSTSTTTTPGSIAAAQRTRKESRSSPEDWYAAGERVGYNLNDKTIVLEQQQRDTSTTSNKSVLRVFRRVVVPFKDNADKSRQRWMTFLPNDPEGSFGFHAVEDMLALGTTTTTMTMPPTPTATKKGRCDTDFTESSFESMIRNHAYTQGLLGTCKSRDESVDEEETQLPRLYIDYLGQGDSDTPSAEQWATTSTTTEDRLTTPSLIAQRADLVEAHWHQLGLERTVVVSAGEASSLVVLELLQRQRTRMAEGCPFPKILHVLALNGRFVSKTRHVGRLPTAVQLLRSTLGPSLVHQSRRSNLILQQCLGPSLAGCSPAARKQVTQVVRRRQHDDDDIDNDNCSSMIHVAHIMDEHLQASHRYRWHLAHLLSVFLIEQGITVSLVATKKNRTASNQIRLVQQQVHDYELDDHYPSHLFHRTIPGPASTAAFLLNGKANHLVPFCQLVARLADAEIPMSNNGPLSDVLLQQQPLDESQHLHGDDVAVVEDESNRLVLDEVAQDPLLDTDIVCDVHDMEDDDFELF